VKVVVLTAKNIYAEGAGDSTLSRELVAALAGEASTTLVSFDSHATEVRQDHVAGHRRVLVPKPGTRPDVLVAKSLLHGRSVVHARYRSRRLRQVVQELGPDLVVAEHAYMAEEVMRSSDPWSLVVNNHVSEADVLRAGNVKDRALSIGVLQDELRANRRAARSLTFDRRQAARLKSGGASSVHTIDLVLRPRERPQRLGDRILFVGDQRWGPNREAVDSLIRIVNHLEAKGVTVGVDVVGRSPEKPYRNAPASMVFHGYVEDIDAVYSTARCLIAPVLTGGGVRVKILDAVSRGLPVVATVEAAGDIPKYLPLRGLASDELLIDELLRILRNHDEAEEAGVKLWEAAAGLWRSSTLADAVLRGQL
jgi:glycosyltransferase involved in cell wall biosynthesis